MSGKVVWHDLNTRDTAKAAAFYGEVFGWTHEEVKMPMGTYRMLKSGDAYVGGVMQMPPGVAAPPHWLSYVAVTDVDKTAASAVNLGAMQHVPPTDIPDVGRFSVNADPQGAVFALYKPAAKTG